MLLKDFLIKYTAISKKFINDYYKFYEICVSNKFGISVESVANYLEINNIYHFTERIRKKYVVNVDYVIIRRKGESMKGIQDVYYFISFDCFEKICMQSKTKKANDVRDYFITLRKFIDYYKNHFANKINELVETDKSIYIILANKNKSILKIGKTNNMRKRLINYSTGKDKHPDIKFIMHTTDPDTIEDCSKIFAKIYKLRGKQELYKMDIDKLKKIIFDCAMIKNKIDNYDPDNIKKYDTYVIFDDGEEIEYLDTQNNKIGYEKIIK
jgi:phage anti-repressor protein